MSFQVDIALVQSYRANIDLGLQQKGSRLRPYVRVETQNAEFDFYDRIGAVAAVEVTNRHGDTPLISTPHDRRRVALRDFDWADMIDNKDKIRMLADPTSAYVQSAVWALGRAMDDVIIQAFTATAYTGKTGSTTVAFPAASEIAVNYVESGTAANSNLSVGKLRRARYLLDKAEVTTDDSGYDLIMVCDPSQIQSLLRTTEVTSADYNTIKALVQGEIDTFMGFKFIRSNRLTVASNIRECFAFERTGMLLAVGAEIRVDVGPRRDKRNSIQVYASGSFGSTRMWEERVLRVKCDETA
jgi:hypothetical protein